MKNNKVLICEDDEGIIDVESTILKECGYDVKIVTDGRLVIDLINEVLPNLILLDLWMPNVTGEAIAKEVKNNPLTKNIPIIIVSANKDASQIAMSSGANDFIAKPFDIIDLENMVSKYLH